MSKRVQRKLRKLEKGLIVKKVSKRIISILVGNFVKKFVTNGIMHENFFMI